MGAWGISLLWAGVLKDECHLKWSRTYIEAAGMDLEDLSGVDVTSSCSGGGLEGGGNACYCLLC